MSLERVSVKRVEQLKIELSKELKDVEIPLEKEVIEEADIIKNNALICGTLVKDLIETKQLINERLIQIKKKRSSIA